ncbi:MAG TPA: hypothetical protein VII13_08380 [Vicinamibacteria bacterium]|jgi:chromosome segregation ATPase
MADPLLNQLIEEAAEKCTQLFKLMVEAEGHIDTIEENVRTVGEKVETEVDQVKAAFKRAVAALGKAETTIEQAGDKAKGELDDVVAKAGTVAKEITDLAAQVDKAEGALEQAKTTLTTRIETGVQGLETDIGEYGTAAKKAGDDLAEDAKNLSEALKTFSSTVDAPRTELAEQHEAWSDALDGLIDAATAQFDAVGKALGEGADAQAAGMLSMTNAIIVAHTEVMEKIDEKFATEAETSLNTSMGALLQTLVSLVEITGTRQEQVRDHGGTILDGLAKLPEQIGELEETLRHTDRLKE